jgi:hypothetical protein
MAYLADRPANVRDVQDMRNKYMAQMKCSWRPICWFMFGFGLGMAAGVEMMFLFWLVP